MSQKQTNQNVGANNGKNGLVDLNKHVDTAKWGRSTNQEDTIKTILIREFYHNNEYKITNEAPKIKISELSILGYKKPEKAIRSLLANGVIKLLDDNKTIELVTKQVYCNQCRNNPVFIWDKLNHLKTFHYWSEIALKHNIVDTEFSNKPFPEKVDHDYKAIGKLEDNQLRVKCKNCNYERTIYIENRKECDPFRKSVFVDNPDAEKDIEIRFGNNVMILKNQEELKQFIQSKIEELNA